MRTKRARGLSHPGAPSSLPQKTFLIPVWNAKIVNILGESRVEGVRLRIRETGEEWAEECDGVLLAIG